MNLEDIRQSKVGQSHAHTPQTNSLGFHWRRQITDTESRSGGGGGGNQGLGDGWGVSVECGQSSILKDEISKDEWW